MTPEADTLDRRCADVSVAAGEQVAGSASTWNACLMIEQDGPWGPKVLRDTRLSADLRAHLDVAGLRVLLVRRHGRPVPREKVRVMASWSASTEAWIEQRLVDSADDLLDVDLEPLAQGRQPGWDPVTGPVALVCTHGRRDVCCAERGRPLAAALAARDAEATWECSHVGGHRFAPNVVLLPEGVAYGRIEAGEAAALHEAWSSGRLLPERMRGRVWQPPAVQAAEVAVRQRLGLDGVDAVRALPGDDQPDSRSVTVLVDIAAGRSAGRWSVVVEQVPLRSGDAGASVLASCGDADTTAARSWQVGALEPT